MEADSILNTMINSIEQIINFRYKKGHLYADTYHFSKLPLQQIEQILLRQPRVFTNFKLSILPGKKIYFNPDCATNDVFCTTRRIHKLEEIIDTYNFSFDNLVCAGDDELLSDNIEYLKNVRHLFDENIYYEAKDIECKWVTTIPMGMIMFYMLRCGPDTILHHINKTQNKTKLIGSAFGSKWPQLDFTITDRILLNKFTQNSKFVDDIFCNPSDYFERLSDCKFFACPLGNGIQTPKICESILCETVPVVTNHIAHRELRDIYDLPLLIVDKWEDLTEELLNEAYENKFKHIDWQKEKSKFLVENFKNLLI